MGLRISLGPPGVDIELPLLPLQQPPQQLLQGPVSHNALRTEHTNCKNIWNLIKSFVILIVFVIDSLLYYFQIDKLCGEI